MKKNIKILIGVLILFLLFYSFYLRNSNERKLIKKANNIILLIENYKLKNGELPNKLDDIGVKSTEEGPIYYKKEGVDYEIWYIIGFDEANVYYSKDKIWKKSFN